MKAKEFDIKKRDPNWRAMQDIRRSGAGGQHKDKKRAAKQGEVKHKGKDVAEGYTTEKQIMTRIRQIMHDRKLSGTESNAGELHRLKQQLKDMRSQQGVSEGIGGMVAGGIGQFFGNKIDPLHGEIMRSHGEIAGRKAEYTIRKYMHLLQKALKQQLDSGEKEGVSEDSDWGEPREILEDVLQTLEREVEWPLTEVMDPKEVKQLLSPLVRAVNDKMMSMEESQDDWGSMSHREFKRKELQHELGHEDDPEFQRMMRDKDRGPWYIKIDGKIYRQKGEPKVFDWKKGANNYALAMVKNRPELKDKVVLTRKPVDENIEEAKKKMSAKDDPCWKGYKMVGTKKKGGKEVPNCVPGKKGD